MDRKERVLAWLFFAVLISVPMAAQAIWDLIWVSVGVEAFILIILFVLLMIPDEIADKQEHR